MRTLLLLVLLLAAAVGLFAQQGQYSAEAMFGGCKTPSLNYPTYSVTVEHIYEHPKLDKPSVSSTKITRGGEFWEIDYGTQILRCNGAYVADINKEEKSVELIPSLDFDDYIQNPFFYPYDSFSKIGLEGEDIRIRLFKDDWDEEYRDVVYNQEDCIAKSIEFINPNGVKQTYLFKDWELYLKISTSDFETDTAALSKKGWTISDIR